MVVFVLCARFVCILLVLQVLPSSSREVLTSMSEKGKKYAAATPPVGANENQIEDEQISGYAKPLKTGSQTTTTEDPFSFGETDSGHGVESDDWGISKDDDTWADDSTIFEELLPPCDTVESPDTPCTNATVTPPEIRYRDPVLSRLISQVWSDFQSKLNNEAALYGQVIDPLDVDSKLPEPIDLKQSGNMFTVDVKMGGIKIYGLSGIRLEESSVTRSENLTDMKVKVVFAFDSLIVNGTYNLKGQFGWWALDSVGDQLFEISMVNATLTYGMKLEVVGDTGDWSSLRCSASSPDNVLITEIRLPLEYADVNFKFDNLGAFANTVVNAVGIYFLKTQEEMLVGEIRKGIKKSVNSLIC